MGLTIGDDGHHLLSALYESSSPEWLRQLFPLPFLWDVWLYPRLIRQQSH
ncbi:hypothetical protein [Nostoc sp.]